MNIGYVEIRGIETGCQTSFNLPFNIFLRCGLNYSYQKAQDFSDPSDNDFESGTYGSQISYIPWHNLSFISSLEKNNWGVNYSFIYVGERYHNSSNIRENYEQPWYTHDISASKKIKLKYGINIKIAAEINNLLDQQYDVILNYPMPGRNYKLILKLEI